MAASVRHSAPVYSSAADWPLTAATGKVAAMTAAPSPVAPPVSSPPLAPAGPAGPPAAVAGLTRSDPHSQGITRQRAADGPRYLDPSGTVITDPQTLHRITALAIPPAWRDVWISPGPLGHIQATGVDSRGRTQYRYHQLWREQRDTQKFAHMLRFASALPTLRAATVRDLRRRGLGRSAPAR
jgi:DNA topoisomerase I